ncbi:hypothetical protein HUJ04_010751 [Dendroctonus ponderosae]|nr:hypothetical protein HUJ04_010751 [Dendroctonus ponderosae]
MVLGLKACLKEIVRLRTVGARLVAMWLVAPIGVSFNSINIATSSWSSSNHEFLIAATVIVIIRHSYDFFSIFQYFHTTMLKTPRVKIRVHHLILVEVFVGKAVDVFIVEVIWRKNVEAISWGAYIFHYLLVAFSVFDSFGNWLSIDYINFEIFIDFRYVLQIVIFKVFIVWPYNVFVSDFHSIVAQFFQMVIEVRFHTAAVCVVMVVIAMSSFYAFVVSIIVCSSVNIFVAFMLESEAFPPEYSWCSHNPLPYLSFSPFDVVPIPKVFRLSPQLCPRIANGVGVAVPND